MNIFQIDDEILSCIDQETGEVVDTARLESLQMARDEKIEKVALWAKEVRAEMKALKDEKSSLDKRLKSDTTLYDSLIKYLDYALDGQKFKTPKVAMSYRKSESVEIMDITAIPKQFLKYSDPVPDKTALKKAIKEEKMIDGARLVIKNNLQIK